MDYQLIEIGFNPDIANLLKKLGLEADSDEAEDFLALLEKARPLTKPKAALGAAAVDSLEPSGKVVIEGVAFQSGLLAKNLAEVKTAWPYLATCGREIYDFVVAIPDPFERYWGDAIMQQALTDVREALNKRLMDQIYEGKVAAMSPGSLVEWPISQQIPLFKLFGDAAARCGVTLTESLLMLPNKSVSGILFPNEHGYVNCRLCPKENCPNRKAAYEADCDV